MRQYTLRSDRRSVVGALLVILVGWALAGCSDEQSSAVCDDARCVMEGNAERGKSIIATIGCGVCHTIPGVAGAHGVVGTPLNAFGRRQLIAGTIPNEPDALVQWIRDAPSLVPNTGMPNLPLTEEEASDVAAYLYTLNGQVLPGMGSQKSGAPEMWDQSTLVVAGPSAGAIATLTWIMFIGAAVIMLLVIGFAALAIFGGERRRWMANRRFIIGFGIAFPTVTLSILLVYGLATSGQMLAVGPPALRIEVIGEQWWWRINYVDADGKTTLATANEIRVPTGRPVEFVLTTPNVIHSFWVPALGGKLDMIPGRTNRYRLVADQPGIYRGQCAEYCGAQHALMAFYVVAMEEPEFERWYAQQVEAPPEPRTPFLQRGKALFLQSGCGACHVVRGTPANGLIGPDLTYVGIRLSLAAGSYPNNVGTLAGWISSSQHLKPGNHMPSFGNLRGEELRAIAAYLESLR